MAVNRELCLRVAKRIEDNPASLDMEVWWCGTTACIAGWALHESGFDLDAMYDPEHEDWEGPRHDALKLLGLTPVQDKLFFTTEWPVDAQGGSEHEGAVMLLRDLAAGRRDPDTLELVEAAP